MFQTRVQRRSIAFDSNIHSEKKQTCYAKQGKTGSDDIVDYSEAGLCLFMQGAVKHMATSATARQQAHPHEQHKNKDRHTTIAFQSPSPDPQ